APRRVRGAGEGRSSRQQEAAERQAVPAVLLPEGGYARLYQGGVCVPGGAAAARQTRPRRDRRGTRQEEADREVRGEIWADVSACVRRIACSGRTIRYLGREV